MTCFPPFDSLPTAADLEAAAHANDWIYPKQRSAAGADNDKPNHQRIQGYLAGASHPVPTPTPKETQSDRRTERIPA